MKMSCKSSAPDYFMKENYPSPSAYTSMNKFKKNSVPWFAPKAGQYGCDCPERSWSVVQKDDSVFSKARPLSYDGKYSQPAK